MNYTKNEICKTCFHIVYPLLSKIKHWFRTPVPYYYLAEQYSNKRNVVHQTVEKRFYILYRKKKFDRLYVYI